MLYDIHIPKTYLDTFEKHPKRMDFFETHNIPYFIESSSVASHLNSDMIYHLLQFQELDNLVQCFENDVQARLYLSSLYIKEGYHLPYHDVFSGDVGYQHYRGWRLFFSSYLKKYACNRTLIHFVMKTIDAVCKWELYQTNIALTLLYDWIQKAQKHGYNIALFDIGTDFESFMCQIGYVLFYTKDDLVLTRELCKKFHLTFEGHHSFGILMEHFRIWNGCRHFYTKEPAQLSERFVVSVRCEKKRILV